MPPKTKGPKVIPSIYDIFNTGVKGRDYYNMYISLNIDMTSPYGVQILNYNPTATNKHLTLFQLFINSKYHYKISNCFTKRINIIADKIKSVFDATLLNHVINAPDDNYTMLGKTDNMITKVYTLDPSLKNKITQFIKEVTNHILFDILKLDPLYLKLETETLLEQSGNNTDTYIYVYDVDSGDDILALKQFEYPTDWKPHVTLNQFTGGKDEYLKEEKKAKQANLNLNTLKLCNKNADQHGAINNILISYKFSDSLGKKPIDILIPI